MMTSSNGSIFRITGHLCGEFTDPGPVNSPHKGQWRGALMFPLICAWMNGWVNNRKAGDLRRHRSHYDVSVMSKSLKKNSFILVKLSSLRISGARMLFFLFYYSRYIWGRWNTKRYFNSTSACEIFILPTKQKLCLLLFNPRIKL